MQLMTLLRVHWYSQCELQNNKIKSKNEMGNAIIEYLDGWVSKT